MAEMRIEPAHTREMYDENQKKIRSLRLRLATIALVGVVVIVAVLIWRSPTGMDRSREKPAQFAVTAVTLLFGGACLFYRGMRLAPLTAYARYLRELQSGLTREVEGVVVRFAGETSFREGLYFYQLVLNVGDLREEKDERFFYWDALLPRPQLEPGMHVSAKAHGNDLL